MEMAQAPIEENDSDAKYDTILPEERKSYDPAGVHEIKANLKKRLDAALAEQGHNIRRCGSQTELKSSYFNESEGFWNSGRLSKPPRWLFDLSVSEGSLEASLPDHEKNDQLGYYNIRQGEIAGVTARAIPVIEEPDGSFVCYEAWEWLVFVFFEKPLEEGSSSEMISGFAPPNYDLRYQEAVVSPLGVHLYALCNPASEVEIADVQVSYAEATQALVNLFGVDKSESQISPAESEQSGPEASSSSENLTLDFDGANQ